MMFKRKDTYRNQKLLAYFALLLIIVVANSCANLSHVKTLREVQDQFNSATVLENQLKADPLSADATILLRGHSNASYRLVLEDVTKLIDDKRQDLQTDNLLGIAYTLKALTEWRLRDYDAAVKTTNTVINQDIQLFPRDRAVIKALRGLIKNDQAFSHMMQKDHKFKDLKTLLAESAEDINQGISEVPEGNNVRTYLAMAKLAVLKNWLDLFNKPNEFAVAVPSDLNKANEQSEWCDVAQPTWQIFVQEMDRLSTPEAAAAKKWWGDRLALPYACEAR